MIDMSSGFDTIDHKILLHRLLISFGVTGKVLEWFKSYLRDRPQFISVNNYASDSINLSSGVSQSSVLAPSLFVLYLQPLAHVIKKFGFSYHFYADDVQFYISIDERKNIIANVINECLKATKAWLSVNKLKVNCNKTQSFIFSRKHSTTASVFFHDCDSNTLQPLSSVKNLGVIFD